MRVLFSLVSYAFEIGKVGTLWDASWKWCFVNFNRTFNFYISIFDFMVSHFFITPRTFGLIGNLQNEFWYLFRLTVLKSVSLSSILFTFFHFILQGMFTLISLTGALQLPENKGGRNGSGSSLISLAAPDGHVLGGKAAGVLLATTPVQLLLSNGIKIWCQVLPIVWWWKFTILYFVNHIVYVSSFMCVGLTNVWCCDLFPIIYR